MESSRSDNKLWTKDFISISVVNFLLFFSWQMFPFVFPVYLQSIGASDVVLGLITAVTTVSALLIRPFCGFILDKFGRRGIMLAGIAFMALSAATYSIFPSIGAIFVIRFIHGLAWGVASTSASTVASDVIPPRRYGEGIGMFAMAASLALAVAPGLALELFTFEGLFPVMVGAVMALIVAFILSVFIKYQKVTEPKPFSFKGIIERRSVVPSVIIFFLTMAYGALTTFIALHAAAQGVEGIGVFFTVYAIAVAVSRPLLGKFVDTKGYRIIIIPGLLAMVVALIILSFADSLILFVVVALFYGSGFAACNSTLQTMAVADVPFNKRGAANATYLVGFDSGIGVGGIISGIAVSFVGYSGMFFSFALLPVVAGIFFFMFARNRKPPALQDVREMDQ